MRDKRDDRVDERLNRMSLLVEHSDKKSDGKNAELVAINEAKNDILNELPAEIRFQALQNGMSLEELRSLYAEVKVEYAEKKLHSQGGRQVSNNGRRQDNERNERKLAEDRQRQNELIHGRGGRRYERQRVH